MLGVPLALAVFGAGEWAVHRYLLHGLGRVRTSRFAFHYHTHHQSVRKHGGYDPDYEGPVWSTPTQAREAIGLTAVGLAHLPLLPVAPFYTATIWYCLAKYRRDHRRAHLDPEWARAHLAFHYDHHMGDQRKNWGVSWQWFDVVMGTRDRFVGTDKDRVDHPKNTARVTAAIRTTRPKRPLRDVLSEVFRARERITGSG